MRLIVAFIAIAVIAMAAPVGLQTSLENAGDPVDISNESWSPDAGNVTELQDSNIDGAFYDETVDVRDSNGNEMVAGTDYEWLETNGSVKALEGGDLDGETEAYIDYGYRETTREQRDMATVLGQIPRGVGAMLPFVVFVAFVIIIRGG